MPGRLESRRNSGCKKMSSQRMDIVQARNGEDSEAIRSPLLRAAACSPRAAHSQQARRLFVTGIVDDAQHAGHVDRSLALFEPPAERSGRLQNAARVERPDLGAELRGEQLGSEAPEEIAQIA